MAFFKLVFKNFKKTFSKKKAPKAPLKFLENCFDLCGKSVSFLRSIYSIHVGTFEKAPKKLQTRYQKAPEKAPSMSI